MNIFYLHHDPRICARMHVSKHVIKMVLEVTQLLCSAWHMIDPDHEMYEPVYKLTHKNHPSAIWTRASTANYEWLCQLGMELCKEYTYRYKKTHKCEQYIHDLYENTPPLPDKPFTQPTPAMPDTYKYKDSIEAYRSYYFFDKYRMHSWKGKYNSREPPKWIIEMYELFEDDEGLQKILA